MTTCLKLGSWTAGALIATGLSASAAVIDFTDSSIYTSQSGSSATGSVGGIGFTISASGGALTFTPGPGAVNGLVGDYDGIGIGDDEIGAGEYLTIIFDKPIKLTSASFLDLFTSFKGNGDAEHAVLYDGVPPAPGNFVATFQATETYVFGGFGFGSFAVSAMGDTFTFDIGEGNDDEGVGDFALAALSVQLAAIPLPASALLLGGAIGGFGLVAARRRRRAAD